MKEEVNPLSSLLEYDLKADQYPVCDRKLTCHKQGVFNIPIPIS